MSKAKSESKAKPESKELAQFDELKANVTEFVAPVSKIRVKDFASSHEAVNAGKQIKMYLSDVEKVREALVGPLNARLNMINFRAKAIKEPLLIAEQHVKREIARFEDEQEKIREQERRRVEEERQAKVREAEEKRRREEAEIEERRKADLELLNRDKERQARAASIFGSHESTENLAEKRRRIEEDAEREKQEAQARAEQESLLAQREVQQKEWDIDQRRTRNVRKIWKCEAVDLKKVPSEFLITELNKKAVIAAAQGGVTSIPGVKLWQETSVALGAHTYVPEAVIEDEKG